MIKEIIAKIKEDYPTGLTATQKEPVLDILYTEFANEELSERALNQFEAVFEGIDIVLVPADADNNVLLSKLIDFINYVDVVGQAFLTTEA